MIPVALTDMTEKQWSAQVAELARMLGWLRYHTHRSERSPAGFPDEVLVRDRVVFLELKREKGKPSPLQVEWLDRLAKAGAEVYLARPSDLDEVARVLGKPWQHFKDWPGQGPGLGQIDLKYGNKIFWQPSSLWVPGQGRYDQIEKAAA